MSAKPSKLKPSQKPSRRNNRSAEAEEKPKPMPAYAPFELEKDWVGKNLLRRIAMRFYGEALPEHHRELWTLYTDALGKPAPWKCVYDKNGKLVSQKKRTPIPPLEAAETLIKAALDAATFVELLRAHEPEICRKIAVRLPHWPIKADLTKKDWKREGEEIVAEVELGRGISGYLKSARTSDENPIRLYAAAIYETLSQSRWQYKRLKKDKYLTAEGCPQWVEKTIALPLFTRSDASRWMKVGREMLMEQRPDFLDDPLLGEQLFKWRKRAANRSRSGKPTLRAIQNEALGDFAKELRNLAPMENVYRGQW